MRIEESKENKSSKLGKKKIMKIQVMNQICVKRVDSNLFVDNMQSIDELSMLVLSSAEKLGSP